MNCEAQMVHTLLKNEEIASRKETGTARGKEERGRGKGEERGKEAGRKSRKGREASKEEGQEGKEEGWKRK